MPIRITGLNSGLDTESIISALVSSYNYKTEKYKKAQTKLSWKQDAWKELNTKIYSLYKNVGNLKLGSSYNLKKATVSDPSKANITAGSNAVNGTYSVQVTKLARAGYLTGGVINGALSKSTNMGMLGYTGGEGNFNVTVKGKTTAIKVDGSTTIDNVVKQLNEAGVNASFDEKNKRIFVAAKDMGTENDFSITAGANGEDILNYLGLNENNTIAGDMGPIRIKGQNSTIYVNGAKFEGTTNTVAVNGLTIEAIGVTGTEYDPTGTNAFTVGVSTDSQGIYDKVKDFLTQYNELINEMTSLYNAENAKGYEPLTEDEKEQMSEGEIEKWEEKIKASLLRRDDTLSGLMSVMTNAMSKSFEINGKNYSLSSFGIQTLGFLNAPKNEHNAYHIDGDADDANTSGKEDKLMAMINEDPETVIEFMKKLSTSLYEAVDVKMKSTTLSSVYTVYNDKEMASEYSDYTSTISKWEKKLKEKEDYYYKQFSKMETALGEINSQSSSLGGLFGM